MRPDTLLECPGVVRPEAGGTVVVRHTVQPTAAFYVDLLAKHGPLLDEPYTRQLDGRLREPRFYLDGAAMRITYWIATGRRIILLTVFHKTQMREDRQVDRARRALARCMEAEHTVEEKE